ncbi:MAG TPA: hypothetical protein VMA09_06600 [Candidatus Binataceae bacterium]|nr:hypothetical protein [Candidatus Binataceae bacterium]
MLTYSALPDTPLQTAGEISADFLQAGARTYREAAAIVYRLPYGRTSSRTDLSAVLREGRGTCSSKHALLRQLASEQGVAIKLMIGIYLMNERNTPGVGAVLSRCRLKEIPEAHCYIVYDDERIDVTRAVTTSVEPIASFLHEEEISPPQIGDYKIAMHRDFLRRWLPGAKLPAEWNFARLWSAREECIAALAS